MTFDTSVKSVKDEIVTDRPKQSKKELKPIYGPVPDPLPSTVTLQDIVKTMPKEVFQKNMFKAFAQVVLTYSSVALSMYLIYLSPWYLLPVVWSFAGTAATGLFVIGHDCGHLSFAKQRWLNDLVGIISFLPCLYPFEPWRIQHNHHHAHTNKLHIDNAWQPFTAEWFKQANPIERVVLGGCKQFFFFFASIGHQIKEHFFLSLFTERQLPRVKFSLSCVYLFAAIFFPVMLYTVGLTGIFKYWVMPFLGFHFWLSTFTMVHHTLPHLPFLPEGEWNDAQARLTLTVHCEYPAWVERLCHHINVHVPHHVSTSIPSYNLRAAHQSLLKNWGRYMTSIDFSWELLQDITQKCHLYDEDECYAPFSAVDDVLAKKTPIKLD